jgi:hypothetical protein
LETVAGLLWTGEKMNHRTIVKIAHGSVNCEILTEKVDNLPNEAKKELAQMLRNIAADLGDAATTETQESAIKAAQITMGRGLVDVSRIEHEGRAGILFRPRDHHIPIGDEGDLPPGDYWPVDGDVIIWIENEAGAQVVQKYLSLFIPTAPETRKTVAWLSQNIDNPESFWLAKPHEEATATWSAAFPVCRTDSHDANSLSDFDQEPPTRAYVNLLKSEIEKLRGENAFLRKVLAEDGLTATNPPAPVTFSDTESKRND